MAASTEADLPRCQVCEVCCKEAASHRCGSCDQVMCNTCTAVHASIKTTRLHNVDLLPGAQCDVKVKKEPADASVRTEVSNERFCVVHKDEKLRFFCTQCCKVVCRDCKLTSHDGHPTIDLVDKSAEGKRLIVEVAKMSRNSVEPLLQKAIREAESHREQVRNKKQSILAALDVHALMLKKEIDRNLQYAKDTLSQETDDIEDRVAKCIDSMYKELTCLRSLTEHAQSLAQRGGDTDVLEMTAILQETFGSEIKSEINEPCTSGFTFLGFEKRKLQSASVEALALDNSKLKSFVNDWKLDIKLTNDCPFRGQQQKCPYCSRSFDYHGVCPCSMSGGITSAPRCLCDIQYSCSTCKRRPSTHANLNASNTHKKPYCSHRLPTKLIPFEEVLPLIFPVISQYIGQVRKVDKTYNSTIKQRAASSTQTQGFGWGQPSLAASRKRTAGQMEEQPALTESKTRQIVSAVKNIRRLFADWQTNLKKKKAV